MPNEIVPKEAQSAIDRFIEKLSLPEIIAGSAGKAISRLVAGVIDIPSAYLDSFAQSIKDKTVSKTLVNHEVASAAAKLAAGDSDIVARAAHNLLAKEYRHQKNKEDIAKKTLEILQEETKSNPAPGPGPQSPSPNVEDDWLNIFEQYAENASSERMQALWARILAGEIRSPKTFSLKTLRFISELDQRTAQLFEKYVPRICANAISTEGGLRGDPLSELLHLQESGLLTGVGGMINRIVDLGSGGQTIVANQGRMILIQGQPNQKIQYSAALLTNIGTEIAQLVKVPFDINAARVFADMIPKDNITLIAYCSIKPSGNGIEFVPTDTLWAPPKPENV